MNIEEEILFYKELVESGKYLDLYNKKRVIIFQELCDIINTQKIGWEKEFVKLYKKLNLISDLDLMFLLASCKSHL